MTPDEFDPSWERGVAAGVAHPAAKAATSHATARQAYRAPCKQAEDRSAHHRKLAIELIASTEPVDDDMARVSVMDTGPGLGKVAAVRLFQPFVTTKPQGMGVGLSISRMIVEAHGGRIWCEPNPGGGTLFRFTVRLAQIPVQE